MSARTSWIQATVLHCDGEGGICTKEERAELAHEWGTYHDGKGRLDLCREHRTALSAELGLAEVLPARCVEGREYRFDVIG
jgi:hypothetical protein